MDFSGQTPSLELSVRVLPSGAAHSRGGRSLLGVGAAAPAPFLAPWQAGMGHSGTFQDIPSAAVGAQPCPRFSRSVWNFVGGNVAGEISTCHEQIRFIRERGLAFFASVGGWTVVFVCSGWRREGSVPCV